MPRHRGRHLAQRIGEDIRQHQIERAAPRELRRRKAHRLDRFHQIAGPIPTTSGLGSPLAPFVLTRARIGPNEASSECSPLSRQLCTSPMNEIFGVCNVLPIGVLQQPAYQRNKPFSVSRMQANASLPWVKVRFLGGTCMICDPPRSSSTASGRPRKCAKA